VSRTNLTPQPRCAECSTPDVDVDEYGVCFDCSDVRDPDPIEPCTGCGNDDGYFDGLCLDCLEET